MWNNASPIFISDIVHQACPRISIPIRYSWIFAILCTLLCNWQKMISRGWLLLIVTTKECKSGTKKCRRKRAKLSTLEYTVPMVVVERRRFDTRRPRNARTEFTCFIHYGQETRRQNFHGVGNYIYTYSIGLHIFVLPLTSWTETVFGCLTVISSCACAKGLLNRKNQDNRERVFTRCQSEQLRFIEIGGNVRNA